MDVPLLAREVQIRLTLPDHRTFCNRARQLGSPPSGAPRSPSLTSEAFDGGEPYVHDKEWSEEKGKSIIDADFVMVS